MAPGGGGGYQFMQSIFAGPVNQHGVATASTAMYFDPEQELVWIGNERGYISSYALIASPANLLEPPPTLPPSLLAPTRTPSHLPRAAAVVLGAIVHLHTEPRRRHWNHHQPPPNHRQPPTTTTATQVSWQLAQQVHGVQMPRRGRPRHRRLQSKAGHRRRRERSDRAQAGHGVDYDRPWVGRAAVYNDFDIVWTISHIFSISTPPTSAV